MFFLNAVVALLQHLVKYSFIYKKNVFMWLYENKEQYIGILSLSDQVIKCATHALKQ